MDEYPPPWVALPDLQPEDPATQRLAEAYIVLNWYPFWSSLTPAQKASYLDRWNASAEWRDAIAARYDADPIMLADEAREEAATLNAVSGSGDLGGSYGDKKRALARGIPAAAVARPPALSGFRGTLNAMLGVDVTTMGIWSLSLHPVGDDHDEAEH